MLLRLFGKECRQVVRGILYIVFVGAVVLFFATQFGNAAGDDIADAEGKAEQVEYAGGYTPSQPLVRPQPGQESYGTVNAEVPETVMPNVVSRLNSEYSANQYTTYPIGFYKSVRLDEAEQKQVADAIETVTGLAVSDLDARIEEWYEQNIVVQEDGTPTLYMDALGTAPVPIAVDYETFKQVMAGVDEMLGGGSYYDPAGFASFGTLPKTYEQALAEYEALVNQDHITGAYARLFCDYMGISLGLFSVFVPVGFLLRDRRAKMQEVVFSRKASSLSIVCARYLACLAAVLVPVVLLSIPATVQLCLFAARQGLSADPFAFLAYIGGWLLPTAMVCCSVGFFFTILTDTPLGIAVQFFWCFLDVFASANSINGGRYGAALIIRHNQIGGRELMEAGWDSLVMNRLGYAALALFLLALSVAAFEAKRRGMLDVHGSLTKIFRRSKNPVPADLAV